jgi:hypothetical protein
MDLDRASYGEKIAAVSAILLSILMSTHWFGTKTSDESGLRLFSVGHSAWDALDYIPIILLVTIVAAVATAALRLMTSADKLPVPANPVVAFLGTVSTLLILFRIVNPPSFGSFRTSFGTVSIEGTAQFRILLAVFAASGIALGGCLAMWEEGFSIADLHAAGR